MGQEDITMDVPALLLDTCAAIWFAEDQDVSEAALDALDEAFDAGAHVCLSPISAWEVGLLVARGRIKLPATPQLWFRRLIELPGMKLADMSPDVLVASSFLPGTLPSDPADRILAATAREFGYILITRDRPLLNYAEQGYIRAIAC
jgi:PIN domain nuclease of toxin-antitoxin system